MLINIRRLIPLLIACFISLACDDRPAASSPDVRAAERRAEQQGPPRPTTQMLLTGAKKRQTLAPIPFSVAVPTQWKFGSPKGLSVILLEGPTPSGEAQIQVNMHPSLDKEKLDIILRGARKEAADEPAKVQVDVRNLSPNITVLERRQIGSPGPLMVGPIGEEKEIIVTNYKWTVTMFVPRDQTNKEFDRHELNFVGLTKEQYDQDKELLEPIIKSLQYDASAAPATTQAAP